MRQLVVLILGILLAAGPAGAAASEPDPITWSLTIPLAESLKPGASFDVQVGAKIKAGWHLYALTQPDDGPLPTRITLPEGQPFELGGQIKSPPPLTDQDENFGLETQFFNGSVTFTLPVKVRRNATAGQYKLQVETFFQACSDHLCLPPQTVSLELDVTVAAPRLNTRKGQ